jgi:hypothetical protein
LRFRAKIPIESKLKSNCKSNNCELCKKMAKRQKKNSYTSRIQMCINYRGANLSTDHCFCWAPNVACSNPSKFPKNKAPCLGTSLPLNGLHLWRRSKMSVGAELNVPGLFGWPTHQMGKSPVCFGAFRRPLKFDFNLELF